MGLLKHFNVRFLENNCSMLCAETSRLEDESLNEKHHLWPILMQFKPHSNIFLSGCCLPKSKAAKIYIFLNKLIVRELCKKVLMKKSFSGTGIRTLKLLACVFFPWHYLPSRKHIRLTIGCSNVTLVSTVLR